MHRVDQLPVWLEARDAGAWELVQILQTDPVDVKGVGVKDLLNVRKRRG